MKPSEIAKSLLLEGGLEADMSTPNRRLARAYRRLREAAMKLNSKEGREAIGSCGWWIIDPIRDALEETDETE